VVQGGPDSERDDAGVAVRPLELRPDDRGHFAEIFRSSDPIASGLEVRQASLSRTRAGVIKAFHYHERQDDLFCPVSGTARIVLVDLRAGSDTHGVANSVFAGELYPKSGAHSGGGRPRSEVLPGADLVLVYFTNREYDRAMSTGSHDDPGSLSPSGVRSR
jgi:dTDP-4-dehydrorhamnose 3,5-epimerase